MRFVEVIQNEPDENYPVHKHSSNCWEMGFKPVMYGYQFCVGRKGDQFYTLQYCGGNQKIFWEILFSAVKGILEFLPEEISPRRMQDLLPGLPRTKPLYKDANWQHLFILLRQLQSGCQWETIPKYFVQYSQIDHEAYHFLLFADQVEIGKLIALLNNEYWLILNIFVDELQRRQGLGTYLLQASCQIMWDLYYYPCRIDRCPEEFLPDWYKVMGFEEYQRSFERVPGNYNYGIAHFLKWE